MHLRLALKNAWRNPNFFQKSKSVAFSKNFKLYSSVLGAIGSSVLIYSTSTINANCDYKEVKPTERKNTYFPTVS